MHFTFKGHFPRLFDPFYIHGSKDALRTISGISPQSGRPQLGNITITFTLQADLMCLLLVAHQYAVVAPLTVDYKSQEALQRLPVVKNCTPKLVDTCIRSLQINVQYTSPACSLAHKRQDKNEKYTWKCVEKEYLFVDIGGGPVCRIFV